MIPSPATAKVFQGASSSRGNRGGKVAKMHRQLHSALPSVSSSSSFRKVPSLPP
jgi:hypothetical protein